MTRSVSLPQVLTFVAVLMCGCVHSYYKLEVVDWREVAPGCRGNGESEAVVDPTKLDTVWVSTEKTIFYPRDFYFCKPRYIGDWRNWAIDTLCRFPTVFIELPFSLLNYSFAEVPISVGSTMTMEISDEVFYSKARISCWQMGQSVVLTNKIDDAGHGVMSACVVRGNEDGELSLDMTYWYESGGRTHEIPIGVGPMCNLIYFTGRHECFLLREFTSWDACNRSFCGIAIREDYKWPIPFLWRIDLLTGIRETVAWLDKGEIVYSSKRDQPL